MIATALPIAALHNLVHQWPIFIVGVSAVLIVSTLLGFLLAARNFLPGSTAIWGTGPGAASVMTLMADHYGADIRMVALMQYLRVVLVTITAILVTHFALPHHDAVVQTHHLRLFEQIAWPALARTLGVIICCVWVARRFQLPGGVIFTTIIICVLAANLNWIVIELPQVVLLISYSFLGWYIGFRFNRSMLGYAVRAIPGILISTVLLIGCCGLMSLVLAKVAHIDPVTAYLAMSPGGADSIAIIAASGPIDLSFVMTMQTSRLLIMVLLGPIFARLSADAYAKRQLKNTT
jgi:membrane AbrB-like protein